MRIVLSVVLWVVACGENQVPTQPGSDPPTVVAQPVAAEPAAFPQRPSGSFAVRPAQAAGPGGLAQSMLTDSITIAVHQYNGVLCERGEHPERLPRASTSEAISDYMLDPRTEQQTVEFMILDGREVDLCYSRYRAVRLWTEDGELIAFASRNQGGIVIGDIVPAPEARVGAQEALQGHGPDPMTAM